MSKKKFWIIGLIILIIIPIALFILQNKTANNQPSTNSSQTNKEDQRISIKIAQSPVSFAIGFPFFVAQEKGFFDQNGLKVQLEEMQLSISIQALLSKEVDYIPFAREAITASQKDAPIKTIMTFAKNSCLAIASQPGLKINDIKKITVGSSPSTPYYSALKFINDNKLSAEIVTSGENPGATSALLKTKQADAAVQSIISILLLQNQGYTLLETFDDEIPQGLATTDEKIKNSPEEVEKVIKSIQSALEFIKTNPEETKKLILKFSKMETNADTQKIAEEVYPIAKQSFSYGDIPSKEGIEILIKLAKTGVFKTFEDVVNQTVSEEDIAKSFDFRFVKSSE